MGSATLSDFYASFFGKHVDLLIPATKELGYCQFLCEKSVSKSIPK